MIEKEKAKRILKDNGENFSEEEIDKIIKILYKQAKIAKKEFNKITYKDRIENGGKKI